MTQEQRIQRDAWRDAIEASNPEVFDLTLKADASRMALTRATENAYREAARPIMEAKAARQGRPGSIEDTLPTNFLATAGLVDSGILTPQEMSQIRGAADDIMLNREDFLASERRAEADQRALELAQRKNRSGVPDAPLKKTWHEAVLKRMIREAAEKGYDSVSWTTGAQQNKRWRLSNFVNDLQYDPLHHRLTGSSREQARAFSEVVPPDKLHEYIGKEAAEKLLATPETHADGSAIEPSRMNPNPRGFHVLKGADLEVGGQGMRGFYDKMLVDAANKIAKPFGGKVTSGTIDTASHNPARFEPVSRGGGLWRIVDNQTERGEYVGPSFATKAEAEAWLKANKPTTETVHTLDITPTMRDAAVGKGFPLFMSGVPVVRVEHDPFAEDDRNRGQ